MSEFHDTHPLVNEIGEALRVGGLTHGAATRAARAIFELVSKRLTTDVHKPCEALLSEEGRRKYLLGYEDGKRDALSEQTKRKGRA
jgi:hypothetical protein